MKLVTSASFQKNRTRKKETRNTGIKVSREFSLPERCILARVSESKRIWRDERTKEREKKRVP